MLARQERCTAGQKLQARCGLLIAVLVLVVVAATYPIDADWILWAQGWELESSSLRSSSSDRLATTADSVHQRAKVVAAEKRLRDGASWNHLLRDGVHVVVCATDGMEMPAAALTALHQLIVPQHMPLHLTLCGDPTWVNGIQWSQGSFALGPMTRMSVESVLRCMRAASKEALGAKWTLLTTEAEAALLTPLSLGVLYSTTQIIRSPSGAGPEFVSLAAAPLASLQGGGPFTLSHALLKGGTGHEQVQLPIAVQSSRLKHMQQWLLSKSVSQGAKGGAVGLGGMAAQISAYASAHELLTLVCTAPLHERYKCLEAPERPPVVDKEGSFGPEGALTAELSALERSIAMGSATPVMRQGGVPVMLVVGSGSSVAWAGNWLCWAAQQKQLLPRTVVLCLSRQCWDTMHRHALSHQLLALRGIDVQWQVVARHWPAGGPLLTAASLRAVQLAVLRTTAKRMGPLLAVSPASIPTTDISLAAQGILQEDSHKEVFLLQDGGKGGPVFSPGAILAQKGASTEKQLGALWRLLVQEGSADGATALHGQPLPPGSSVDLMAEALRTVVAAEAGTGPPLHAWFGGGGQLQLPTVEGLPRLHALPTRSAAQSAQQWSHLQPSRRNVEELSEHTDLLVMGPLTAAGQVASTDVVMAQARLLWRQSLSDPLVCVSPHVPLQAAVQAERLFVVLRLAAVVALAYALTVCVFQATSGDGVVCGLTNKRPTATEGQRQLNSYHAE